MIREQQIDHSKEKDNESFNEKTEKNDLSNLGKNCAYVVVDKFICDASYMELPIESMPIVPMCLKAKGKEIVIYAMLDFCSTGSFITEDIFKQLEVSGTATRVKIRTMNCPRTHYTKAVNGLVISDLNGANDNLFRKFSPEMRYLQLGKRYHA